MKIATDITNASPKTRRRVRYEWELEAQALDCVFRAHKTSEFKLLMESKVYNDKRYDHLPQYRRVALEAYVRGAMDFAARVLGQPLSQPPDAVAPKARATTPPAADVTQTIIPPAHKPRISAKRNKTPTMPGGVGPSGASYPAGVWSLVPLAARTLQEAAQER